MPHRVDGDLHLGEHGLDGLGHAGDALDLSLLQEQVGIGCNHLRSGFPQIEFER